MELTREQVNVGIAAGLALTNPEDDKLYVPVKHCAGTLVLRQLLLSLASGKLGLTSTMQEAPTPEPPEPPKTPKTPKKAATKK